MAVRLREIAPLRTVDGGILAEDAQVIAEQIVRALHLNPARHYPNIFIDFASNLTDRRLWSFALGALAYSTVRLVEAYGLWHERSWAEWFAAASGAIYIPFEIRHLLVHQHHRVLTSLVLAANIVIVGVMIRALRKRGAIHA